MKEFSHSDPKSVARYASEILKVLVRKTGSVKVMEVCGTHTVAIFRSGLRSLLPKEVSLLSGPGCPVCVTAQGDIDRAIAAAELSNIAVCTYGDMIRVPGYGGSLREARLRGGDVRVVMSAMDIIPWAIAEPKKEFVFFAVGFETTTPQTAQLLKEAERLSIPNISVLLHHKRVLPALESLANDPKIGINGFILPGHVSTIIGMEPYTLLPEKYGIACAIAGFEGQQILLAIASIMAQIAQKNPKVVNAYKTGVRDGGNPTARSLIDEFFTPCDCIWRGLGAIPMSGLKLRDHILHRDAATKFDLPQFKEIEIPGCRCGEILRGRMLPQECPLFGSRCTPQDPIGPCMVSSEGSCGAWYRYGDKSRGKK